MSIILLGGEYNKRFQDYVLNYEFLDYKRRLVKEFYSILGNKSLYKILDIVYEGKKDFQTIRENASLKINKLVFNIALLRNHNFLEYDFRMDEKNFVITDKGREVFDLFNSIKKNDFTSLLYNNNISEQNQ